MNLFQTLQAEKLQHTTRRQFLRDCTTGLGGMWLASHGLANSAGPVKISHEPSSPLEPQPPSYAPK